MLRRKECGTWVCMVKESLSEKVRLKPWGRSFHTNLILSHPLNSCLAPQRAPDPSLPHQLLPQCLSLFVTPESWTLMVPTGGQAFLSPGDHPGYASPTKPCTSSSTGRCFLISQFHGNTAAETSDFKLPISSPHFSHSLLVLSFPSLYFHNP